MRSALKLIAISVLLALCAGTARAAAPPAPVDFAGVPLGASLKELKQRHPEVGRNPDSDRQFQVYQAVELRGVTPKSTVAFLIYKGRLVGGQVMMDQYNARYWYDQMVHRYGKP